MTKAIKTKVNGVVKNVVNVWTKQGGVVKQQVIPKLNVGGVYKECMSYESEELYSVDYRNDQINLIDEENGTVIETKPINTLTESVYSYAGMGQRLFGQVKNNFFADFHEYDTEAWNIISTTNNVNIDLSYYSVFSGTYNKLFTANKQELFYELNPDTFAILNSNNNGSETSMALMCSSSKMFHFMDNDPYSRKELSEIDLNLLNYIESPVATYSDSYIFKSGCGLNSRYFAREGNYKVREYDTNGANLNYYDVAYDSMLAGLKLEI